MSGAYAFNFKASHSLKYLSINRYDIIAHCQATICYHLGVVKVRLDHSFSWLWFIIYHIALQYLAYIYIGVREVSLHGCSHIFIPSIYFLHCQASRLYQAMKKFPSGGSCKDYCWQYHTLLLGQLCINWMHLLSCTVKVQKKCYMRQTSFRSMKSSSHQANHSKKGDLCTCCCLLHLWIALQWTRYGRSRCPPDYLSWILPFRIVQDVDRFIIYTLGTFRTKFYFSNIWLSLFSVDQLMNKSLGS